MKKIIALIVLGLVLSAGALFAQDGCPMCSGGGIHGGMMGGRGMMATMGISRLLMHQDDLKLSPDQVSKIQKIRSDSTKDLIKRQADIRVAMMDVFENLRAPNPNFTNAKNAMKKVSDLQLAEANAGIDAYSNAFNVLTADQKNMLSQLAGKMMRGMGKDEE